MKSRHFFLFLFLFTISIIQAQELSELLDKEYADTTHLTEATFKTTRITIGHSIETRKKGILEVLLINRFWDRPGTSSQSFMADRLSTRVALEYAISDRLSTGVGGTTWDGLFDGYLKYRLVRQAEGDNNVPISITLFQGASYYSEGIADPSIEDDLSYRLSYTSQVLVASKLSRKLSLQITPTFVHKGLNYSDANPQNHWAIGFGGRFKLGGHVSFASEYYAVLNPLKSRKTYGPFSMGVNWEVGPVMLQFMLTNAVNIVEDAYIIETRNNFNLRNPNLNLGVNISYLIHFNKKLKNLDEGF